MTEKVKLALLRVLFSFGILTIGMITNSIFDHFGQDGIAYNVFTISWSLALFLVVFSLMQIAKPIASIYRGYLMFLFLSFTNLCNALTFATTKVYQPLMWMIAGFVVFSIILINEALIKERK